MVLRPLIFQGEGVYASQTMRAIAGSDDCLRDWQAGPYAKGPPTYMRDSLEHEHIVSPPPFVAPAALDASLAYFE